MNTIEVSSCTTWLHRTAMTHRNFGVLWRNAWTLYDSSIEDRTMEIEADHGHQGVGSCP